MSSQLVAFLEEIQSFITEDRITLELKDRLSGSKDCFHFSPILIPQLEEKAADVIVKPADQEQLKSLIGCAAKYRIPITPRGAGTGNYGQGVPLFGGVLINTKDLNRIVSLSADEVTAEAGVILYEIEKAAADVGAELRCFPSTVPTSSTAGFITGGSGGVGSIKYGMLREADNVRGAKIMTIEESPRVIEVTGPEMAGVLHNCGLTCFVTEVTLALAPKTAWHQYVLSFDDFYDALMAAQRLAEDTSLNKRLVTAFEWPMPSFFIPLVKKGASPEGKSAVFLYTDIDLDAAEVLARDIGATISLHEPPNEGGRRGTQIYDYTWNHTTQWAMKADSEFTYLQDRLELSRMREQIEARKAAFPGELIEHIEFTTSGGEIFAGGLTVVRFKGEARLNELIAWCEANGISVSNPHTYYLDDDTRWYGDEFLRAKERWDPYGLLNPGHLHALEEQAS